MHSKQNDFKLITIIYRIVVHLLIAAAFRQGFEVMNRRRMNRWRMHLPYVDGCASTRRCKNFSSIFSGCLKVSIRPVNRAECGARHRDDGFTFLIYFYGIFRGNIFTWNFLAWKFPWKSVEVDLTPWSSPWKLVKADLLPLNLVEASIERHGIFIYRGSGNFYSLLLSVAASTNKYIPSKLPWDSIYSYIVPPTITNFQLLPQDVPQECTDLCTIYFHGRFHHASWCKLPCKCICLHGRCHGVGGRMFTCMEISIEVCGSFHRSAWKVSTLGGRLTLLPLICWSFRKNSPCKFALPSIYPYILPPTSTSSTNFQLLPQD